MKNIEKINKRQEDFMSIINFFESKGAKEVVLRNTYDVAIVVTDWCRPDMKGEEICDMVDKLIEKCPKTEHFNLERICNCVYVIHKDIYED